MMGTLFEKYMLMFLTCFYRSSLKELSLETKFKQASGRIIRLLITYLLFNPVDEARQNFSKVYSCFVSFRKSFDFVLRLFVCKALWHWCARDGNLLLS
jgi:hypothetical protein